MKFSAFRILNLVLLLTVWGTNTYANNFRFKNYSLQEGVAQSQVYSILEDSRGYLWMGTMGGGLCRFDGNQFVVYNSSQGLSSNFILNIAEDNKGRIWLGTHNGISVFDGHTFTPISLTRSPEDRLRVYSLLPQDSGVWAGTSNGLFWVDSNSEAHPLGPDGLVDHHIHDILAMGDEVWIATNKGLYREKQGKFTRFSENDGLNEDYIQSLEPDGDSAIWIGTYGSGLNRYVMGRDVFSSVIPKALYHNLIIYDLLVENDELWIATQRRGLGRFNADKRRLSWLTEKDGLSNDHVRSICKDSWGNLWFGTSGGGVSKYYGQVFEHFSSENALPGSYIYSIHEKDSADMWIGVSALGVVNYRNGEFVHYGQDSGFANVKVKSITHDKFGRIWLGTEGRGVVVKDSSRYTWLEIRDGLAGNYIKDLEVDKDSNIWVATLDGGISKITVSESLKDLEFTNFVYLRELPSNRIFSLHVDDQNRTWFGTENKGLGVIENNEARMVASGVELKFNTIRAIRTDSNQNPYLATSGGLYCYTKDSGILKVNGSLTSENIYLLEWGADGKLYLGSERGLDVLTIADLTEVIELEHFGELEGFVGIETCQNASILAQNNVLWFGTINGLTSYSPGQQLNNNVPPILRIEQVNLFDGPVSESAYSNTIDHWGRQLKKLVLPWHENHISFDFNAINLNAPDHVLYTWKVEGLDENWTSPSNRSNATYANIPPGKYTFMVHAFNEDMVQTGAPVEWTFEITAPLWQKTWFIALLVLMGVLILSLIIFSRFQRFRAKAKESSERLRMERDLLDLERKALQLQMNPHFIFHALNSIQAVIRQKDEKTARHYLGKFSKLMRAILENSRAEKISLDSEIEALESYCALEQFCNEDSFSYEIIQAPDLDTEEIFIPPMMIQPFVENAIVHGFKGLERKGVLSISFTERDGILYCTVADNGVGFGNGKSSEGHQSTAMKVTSERLASLSSNGRSSDMEVVTGEDTNLGMGTEITLKLVLDH